jgi:NhaA family Na+:H+ antiporter
VKDREPPEPSSSAQRWAPLLAFFQSSTSGGAVLVAAAVVALLWSNSSTATAYQWLLHLPLGVSAAGAGFTLPLHDWIDDGLMAVFFLLVGLEIRREMTDGELNSIRRAAAPLVAALGGMIAPALIYVAFNHSNPAALRGWAVPVATDIAFALAALSLLGRRVPVALKVFLTALAILDDLGAILVIAFFYTDRLNWHALAFAAAVLVVLWGLSRVGVRAIGPYLIGGIVLWAAVYQSGIHPTLAGVALAFVVPMRHRPAEVSTAARLEAGLEGWVAFAILPLFGLANAGLQFNAVSVRTLTDPVFLGITFGLLLGKQVGVFAATMIAAKLKLIHLGGLRWPVLYGGSLLCGIGFTMSLFIGNLAFPAGSRDAEVKLAVFCGSLLSAAAGLIVLRLSAKHPTPAMTR